MQINNHPPPEIANERRAHQELASLHIREKYSQNHRLHPPPFSGRAFGEGVKVFASELSDSAHEYRETGASFANKEEEGTIESDDERVGIFTGVA